MKIDWKAATIATGTVTSCFGFGVLLAYYPLAVGIPAAIIFLVAVWLFYYRLAKKP